MLLEAGDGMYPQPQEVLIMIHAERPSNPKCSDPHPKKAKHRQRKKIYRQKVNLGSPKQLLRSQHLAPPHEKLSDWEAAS